MQVLNGGLLFHAFSAYVLPLQADFGWSRGQLSGAFSMARAESGILGPVQGWAIDRFGPRSMMRIGMVLFGAGFIYLSRIDSLLTFYIAFGLMALGSSLGGFMPLATTVTNWFARKRAMSLGVMMTGMSVGALTVPIVVWSLSEFGWRTTSLASGIIILVVGLPLTQVMRHSPEQYGLLPDGAQQTYRDGKVQAAPKITGLTARQALKTQAFWMLSISHGLALLVVGAALLHQIPHMVEGMGLTAGTAGLVVAVLAIVVITAQLSGGYIGDRINKKVGIAGCMLAHGAGFAIFALSTSLTGALAFAVLHGVAWGVRSPLINSIRADYFGRAHYATIMGFTSMIVMIGMTAGPLFAGIMYDATGNYQVPFLVLAGLAGLGSLAALAARKPKMPVADDAEPTMAPALAKR
ncbi:MAG: MFS transporter [Chloroflexi bacterium]|nr:MFS transporter [Chloroflexota bacterium]